MATVSFLNFPTKNIGNTLTTVVSAVPAGIQYCLNGLALTNTTNTSVTVSAVLTRTDNTNVYIVKDAPVPQGGSLSCAGWDQKINMMTGDQIKVISSTANSIDCIASLASSNTNPSATYAATQYGYTFTTTNLALYVDAVDYPGSGTAIVPEIGSASGLLVGSPTWTVSSGTYWAFNGTSQYISLPTVYTGATQSKTVECWVNITLNTKGPFVGFGNLISGWNIGINNGGQFDDSYATAGSTLQLYVTYTANANIGAATAGWQHLAVVQSASTFTVYRNGTSIFNNTVATGNDPTGQPCWISYMPLGSQTNPQFFGSNPVALARFYTRALSAAEVTANFNSQRGRFGV